MGPPASKRHLNPFNFNASRSLSLFNSAQRFVISYYWELPVPQIQRVHGQDAQRLGVSGITQVPERIPHSPGHRRDDNELINSLFFFGTRRRSLTGLFSTLESQDGNGNYYLRSRPVSPIRPLGQLFDRTATPAHHLLRPGINNWDFSILQEDSVHGKRSTSSSARRSSISSTTQIRQTRTATSRRTRPFGKITAGPRSAPGAVCFEVLFLVAKSRAASRRPGTI